jgi:hypothetical protein
VKLDLLPGKCFWFAEPSVAPTDVSQIGKARANTGNKKQSDTGGTLKKKFGVHVWRRGLVVELLHDKQRSLRPATTSFRVWVQRLLNPDAVGVSRLS